jgi:hypothetical protein
MTPLGHGLGGVRDLPVPTWLFVYGGGAVLIVSFVLLAVLWRRPTLERRAETPLPPALQRILGSTALSVVLGACGLALLAIVFVAALVGERDPALNVAPTFVYIVFWLGLVPVVVLLGDVFHAVNPWRAGASAAAWLSRRAGADWSAPFAYPERLGRWPAAGLLTCWAALELAYWDPADPRALALAIAIYSWITWLAMAAFGTETWLRNGEAFSVYFAFLARIAPFGRREDGTFFVRPPLVGLTRLDAIPGTLAFAAVMLGSVAFDGFSRATWWLDRRYAIESRYVPGSNVAEVLLMAANVAGLLVAILLVAAAYLAAVRAARSLAGYGRGLAGAFVGSLIPVALAYVVAHYFSALVLNGQAAIRLASDPLGRGWDLFGTADFRPDLNVLSANAVWYTQVGVLVAGHVLGLAVAHDRALVLYRSVKTALATQYALLVLMVVYTVGGLWLLWQG